MLMIPENMKGPFGNPAGWLGAHLANVIDGSTQAKFLPKNINISNNVHSPSYNCDRKNSLDFLPLKEVQPYVWANIFGGLFSKYLVRGRRMMVGLPLWVVYALKSVAGAAVKPNATIVFGPCSAGEHYVLRQAGDFVSFLGREGRELAWDQFGDLLCTGIELIE